MYTDLNSVYLTYLVHSIEHSLGYWYR